MESKRNCDGWKCCIELSQDEYLQNVNQKYFMAEKKHAWIFVPNLNWRLWANCHTHSSSTFLLWQSWMLVCSKCSIFIHSPVLHFQIMQENMGCEVDENQKIHLQSLAYWAYSTLERSTGIQLITIYWNLNEITSQSTYPAPSSTAVGFHLSTRINSFIKHKRYYLRVNNMPVISLSSILFSSSHTIMECIIRTWAFTLCLFPWNVLMFLLRYLHKNENKPPYAYTVQERIFLCPKNDANLALTLQTIKYIYLST